MSIYTKGNELVQTDPDEVKAGDTIVIKAGERVPLDGKVLEGSSLLDTSALTGEPVPREVREGSEVLSGCINLTGVLTVEVTREYEESTVSRILDLVENATNKKSRSERFITRFARYYTPVVVAIAVLLAIVPPPSYQRCKFLRLDLPFFGFSGGFLSLCPCHIRTPQLLAASAGLLPGAFWLRAATIWKPWPGPTGLYSIKPAP